MIIILVNTPRQACVVAGEGASCANAGKSEPYVTRTNTELMKIGSTGVTIIGLSQDAGAASKWNMACTQTPSVNPSWPGASPYVTTLGATQVLNGQVLAGSAQSPICNTLTCLNGNTGTEVVCSVQTGALITSGGGFSVYAAQPSYQANAVAGFLKSDALRPPASLFNPQNRGEADISLIGHALQIVWLGKWEAVDGTSASAPIFAGMVTLWQDQRFQQGKAPLGFLNPLLYTMWAQQPNTIRDIVLGNNTATEYPNTCTTPGMFGTVFSIFFPLMRLHAFPSTSLT
jgi:tripeptidyl-peptidase-1